MGGSVEILVVLLAMAVFLGPTVYRTYERYKRRKEGRGEPPIRPGPSYSRHLLGMLGPVFLLMAFFLLLAIGLHFLGR
jgi:hypothetical protein